MNRLFAISFIPLLFLIISPFNAYAETSEMAGFNSRMRSMESTIAERASDRPSQIAAYNTLEAALNMEMDRAYDRVMTMMKPSQRATMTESQHLWLQHRDTEYRWMDQAHGPVLPGSVEHLRVLELRNLMMNARVIQLYSYLDTLPKEGSVVTSDTATESQNGAMIVNNNQLKIATIRGFSLGDGACFLDLRDNNNKNFTEVADSAFCQREGELLDRKVSLTYNLEIVSGATCARDSVACDENNMLIIVKDAKAIRPIRP